MIKTGNQDQVQVGLQECQSMRDVQYRQATMYMQNAHQRSRPQFDLKFLFIWKFGFLWRRCIFC